MIDNLHEILNEKRIDVKSWVDAQLKDKPVPIYSSFDIRDNGIKASIVDSNLFPAGFNNLTNESQYSASLHFKKIIPTLCQSKAILIIPEAHTRNLYYLSNLNTLKKIIENAGYKVIIGSIREDIDETLTVNDSDGRELTLEKMKNAKGILKTKNFDHGLILLNNDFSTPAPELLAQVKECIAPPIKLGWTHRKKMSFFKHFCKLAHSFGEEMKFDHWLICPATKEINDIDFSTGKNIDAIAQETDEMIDGIQKKYDEYKIKEKPFVFIKDNSGTYGMGIITVSSGKDVLELNSKERRSMKSGKEQNPINSVIVQEGIATKHTVNEGTAEPVLYCVGGNVVGGFMRIHNEKDEKSSLNAPGAKFDVLLRDHITRPIVDFIDEKDALSLYSVLAHLGTIAISKEMEEVL